MIDRVRAAPRAALVVFAAALLLHARVPVVSAQPAPPPPNDACEGAITLAGFHITVQGTTLGAAPDAAPACGPGGPPTAPGVWYRFGFGFQGPRTLIDLCGTSPAWDTRLSVYLAGPCGELECLEGDDTGCPGSDLSFVVLDPEPEGDVLILVHGAGAQSGDFTLRVQRTDKYIDCNDNDYPDAWELAENPALDCFDPLVNASPPVRGGPDGLMDACQCPGNWNRDGAVNSNDISSFLASWLGALGGSTLDADIDCSGAANSTDISAFIARWLDAVHGPIPFDGCP